MLHLTVADRVVPLAARLAEVLAVPPADPFEPEWLAVPSEGLRRWLALELARHLGAEGPGAGDGVAANLTTAYPGSLRSAVLAAGRDADDVDPWDVERLAWSVLAVLDAGAADLLLAPLAETASGASRYGRSRRIADLFDRYHVHRPEMVRSWAAGRDVDGVGRVLAGDTASHAWQPHLWRAVRAAIGEPSPPERLPALLERLRAGELAVDLPNRLSVFGASVLPGGAGFVELAAAVSAHRDLHLYLLDPSPATSRLVAAALEPLAVPGPRPRRSDPGLAAVAHPLLRSWGRLPRETAVIVADAAAAGHLPVGSAGPVAAGPAAPATGTVLARLQTDLRSGAAPTGGHVVDPADRSVQVHATHGPARQVEVLRDALLHLLAADPTLQEDDVLVACPALDRFAPFVEAAFGPSSDAAPTADGARPPSLRYRIADRTPGATDPMVAGLEAVLDVAGGRVDAASVADLLAQPAVRRRYRFSDEDLARVDDWVGDTQVRWGLDPAHRAPFGVPAAITANTWQAGLDRLLLGVAVSDDEAGFSFDDVVPLGVEGDDVALLGRLADLLGHLARLADAASQRRPVAEWVDLVADVVAAVLAPDPADGTSAEVVHRALAEVVDHATGPSGPSPVALGFLDLRRLVRDRLAARRGRPDFFRGGITVTSLDPLRAVPHRVVALLGMDQPAFAAPAVSSDDLLAAAPLVGDRDGRAEARQALLELVLSAQDQLLVVRDGHDLRTNQEVPPAVVIAELLEAVAATVGGDGGKALVRGIQVDHPRQPFDERSFDAVAGPLAGLPWSFDPGALAGARARRARVTEPVAFLAEPLAPPAGDPATIELAALKRFLEHPIQRFVEGRLQVTLPREEDARPTQLPVSLVGLDRWKVGDRLLASLLDGGDEERWRRLERRLGTLPPAALGDLKVQEVLAVCRVLVATAQDLEVRPGPPEALPIDLVLADGTRIVGSVEGRLGGVEGGPAVIGFGGPKPKYVLGAWLELAALTAHDPHRSWRAVTVHDAKSKARSGPKAVASELRVPGPPADQLALARQALAVAVDLYRRGRREPLPLFPTVSEALYREAATPSLWHNPRAFPDREDRFVALTHGHLEFRELLAVPARADDPPGTGGRAQRYADHLWGTVARTSTQRDLEVGVGSGAGR